MFRLNYLWFIFHYVIQLSDSQLRIRDGLDLPDTTGDKPYMVYLTLSPSAKVYYDAWICGGAIVSKYYIVTSAACVQDAVYMYAIAGYKHYVRFDQIATDSCTSHVRKKVVEYCIPKNYDFSYTELDKWAHIDIALAKVESSYNLDSTNPEQGCTYPPRRIEISFYKQYQEPGVDAFVLGWGHNQKMRQPEDPLDYNSKELKYATAHIVDKHVCKEAYKKAQIVASSNSFDSTIDNYMICTNGKGNFDFKGTMIDKSFKNVDGCQEFSPNRRLIAECLQSNLNRTTVDTPASRQSSEQPSLDSILRSSYNLDYSDLTRRVDADMRAPGICQNDHGGPLVTWVGAQEYLIGVASVFMIVGHDEECRGPFLFTSTHCNSHFLGCKLRNELDDLRFSKMLAKSSMMRESIVQTTTNRTLDQQSMHVYQGASKQDIKEENIKEENIKEEYNPPPLYTPLYIKDNPPPLYTPLYIKEEDIKEEDINFSNLRRQFDVEAYCNKPAKERGYELIDKKISWRNHPDGPSAIEIEEDRLKALKEGIPLNENPFGNSIFNSKNNQNHSLNDNQNYSLNLNDNQNNDSLNIDSNDNPINNQFYKSHKKLNYNLNKNSNKSTDNPIYNSNYDNFTYYLNNNLTYNLKDNINHNPDVYPVYDPSDKPNYEKLIHNPIDVPNYSSYPNNNRNEKNIFNPTDSSNYNSYEKLIHNPVDVPTHSLNPNNNRDKIPISNLTHSPNHNLYQKPIHNPIGDPNHNPNHNPDEKLFKNPTDSSNYNLHEKQIHNPITDPNHNTSNKLDEKLVYNATDSPNYHPYEIQSPIDDPNDSLNSNNNPNKKLTFNPTDSPNYNPIESPIYNPGGNINRNVNKLPDNKLNAYSTNNPNYNLSDNLNNDELGHNLNNSKIKSIIIDEDESIESIIMRDLV